MLNKPVNILVIEDSELDFEKIQRCCKKLNIKAPLTHAWDGLEGLEFLRKKGGESLTSPKTNVILLDLNMPKMNGIEFLHELREDPNLKSNIVFVITTSAEMGDINLAYSHNIAGYFVKPIEKNEMQDILKLLATYLNRIELPSGELRN